MKKSERKYFDLEYDIAEIKEKLGIADDEHISDVKFIDSGVAYESDQVIVTITKYNRWIKNEGNKNKQ